MTPNEKGKMVYIFNRFIPPKKTIKNALTSIFGVGPKRALEVADYLCINPNNRFFALTSTQISRLCKFLTSNYKDEGGAAKLGSGPLQGRPLLGANLQREIRDNINTLVRARSYKGIRHKNCLPVRGQRTHTNAQTQKKFKRVEGTFREDRNDNKKLHARSENRNGR